MEDSRLDIPLNPKMGVWLIDALMETKNLSAVHSFLTEKVSYLTSKGYFPKEGTTGAFIYGCYFSTGTDKYCNAICQKSLPFLEDPVQNQQCIRNDPPSDPGSCIVPGLGPALKPAIQIDTPWTFPTTVQTTIVRRSMVVKPSNTVMLNRLIETQI